MSDIAKRLRDLADTIRKEQDNTKTPPDTHALPKRPEKVHKWADRGRPKSRAVQPDYTPLEEQNKQVFDANLVLYQLRDQIGRMQAVLISNPAFSDFLLDTLLPLQERVELLERVINEDINTISEKEREAFSLMKTDFFTTLEQKQDDFF